MCSTQHPPSTPTLESVSCVELPARFMTHFLNNTQAMPISGTTRPTPLYSPSRPSPPSASIRTYRILVPAKEGLNAPNRLLQLRHFARELAIPILNIRHGGKMEPVCECVREGLPVGD